MPPFALISSAAICAPPGVAAPATDCTSAITPILMGSPDWAWAGAARQRAMVEAIRPEPTPPWRERSRFIFFSLMILFLAALRPDAEAEVYAFYSALEKQN